MSEKEIIDMIEELPEWEYRSDGFRSSSKSYYQILLDRKDKEIERLNKELEEKEAILGGIQQLEAEIERLQDKILKLETDVSIYKDLSNLRKDRINKAIEFIETFNKTIKNDKRFGGDVDFMTIPKDLSIILEGGDKE